MAAGGGWSASSGSRRGRPAPVPPGLDDDLGSRRADAWEFLQARVPEPPLKLWSRKLLHHLGGPPEGAHPVGRGTRQFQPEGDVAEGLGWIHAV